MAVVAELDQLAEQLALEKLVRREG
jgi:hypothetical protein